MIPFICLCAWRVMNIRKYDLWLGIVFTLSLMATVGYVSIKHVNRYKISNPEKRSTELRILSYNIYFKNQHPHQVVDLIEGANADVILLQEVTPMWSDLLKKNMTGRFVEEIPQNTAHGLGIYSNYPITLLEVIRNRHGLPIAQLFRVHKQGRDLLIAHIHLTSPAGALGDIKSFIPTYRRNAQIREYQYKSILKSMNKLGEKYPNQLIIGDLNTLPAEPLYNEVCTNWQDLYRVKHILPGPTFPYVHKINFPLLTLDYFFGRGGMAVQIINRVSGGSSDHLAIEAVIKF